MQEFPVQNPYQPPVAPQSNLQPAGYGAVDLSRTKTGIKLMLYSIFGLLITTGIAILIGVGVTISGAVTAFILFIPVGIAFVVIGIMSLVGQIMCCMTPPETQAANSAKISLGLSVAAFVIPFMLGFVIGFITSINQGVAPPFLWVLEVISNFTGAILNLSAIFFMLKFLKELTIYLKDTALENENEDVTKVFWVLVGTYGIVVVLSIPARFAGG
ncbi:MAG: hypothetical protein AAFP90_20675, partial [Planctomycetota bacterium]